MESGGNLDLDHQLCIALYNASRAVNGCYRPLLDELGITYSQYAVMLVMWERGTTTLRDLGAALYLDSGTLSPLLKRLETMGLVSRRRHAADERILDVTITPAGTALRSRVAAAQQRVESMTQYDTSEIAALRDELNELAHRMRNASRSLTV
ncbi:MAG: MarR family transcriptional regulator [Ilumatobacteraceae bacterium]